MSRSWTTEECFKYGHILKKRGMTPFEKLLIEMYENGYLPKEELEQYKQNPLWQKEMEE